MSDEVTFSGVTKRFGAATIVDGLNLTFKAGSLSTLLGPSGCGKTTTLRMLAGLEQPTEGRIVVGGQCMCDGLVCSVPAERRGIGMVFQSYAVWPHLNVFDNVAYPLKIRRTARAEIKRRVDDTLHIVRLAHLSERYPSQLSGGQQQRVALARAIVFEPRVLLLDEPLSNLDAQLREQMRVEIRLLQQRLGVTAIYVTHDQQEALAISDFIAVMDHGRVLQQGSPRELFERPLSRFVAEFMGWTNFVPAKVLSANSLQLFNRIITLPRSQSSVFEGDAWAAVRPEDVRIDSGMDEPSYPGRLEAISYFGNFVVCDLIIQGQQLRAHVNKGPVPAVGSEVSVSFALDRLLALPV